MFFFSNIPVLCLDCCRTLLIQIYFKVSYGSAYPEEGPYGYVCRVLFNSEESDVAGHRKWEWTTLRAGAPSFSNTIPTYLQFPQIQFLLPTVPTNTVPTYLQFLQPTVFYDIHIPVPTYLFVIVIFFAFFILGHFIWFSISTRKFQKYWAKNTFTVPSHTYLYIGTGIHDSINFFFIPLYLSTVNPFTTSAKAMSDRPEIFTLDC